MDDVDCLSGFRRWSLGVGEQFEQTNASLEFKPALIVYGADDGDLLRVIPLDEYIDLKIAVVLGVTRRDLLREFAFGKTRRLDLGLDQRHADHPVAFYSYCFA